MEKGIYISTVIILSLVLLGVIISFLTGVLLVPLISTPASVRTEIYQIMGLKKGDMLIDLGSGNGMFLIEACQRYGIKGIGYEISPLGIFISRLLKIPKISCNKNLAIVPNNFLNIAPLPTADKIYCYLNPKAMKSVFKKLVKEDLDKNTKIYSYIYPFEAISEEEKKELSNGNYLYIYKSSSFNI